MAVYTYTESEYELLFDDLMTLPKDDLADAFIQSMTREEIEKHLKDLKDDQ